MKKLISLLCAGALALTSCSSDKNDSITPTKVILPLKTVYTGANGSISTHIRSYIEDKIVRIDYSEGGNNVVTYTGDLISKDVDFDKSNNSTYTNEYSYANDKLKSIVTTIKFGTTTIINKTNYIYNTDGTVDYKEFNVDNVTAVETLSNLGRITFLNGNIIKKTDMLSTITYDYDTKNSSSKNIKGYNKFLDGASKVNNIIKKTTVDNSGAISVRTYEYQYNSDGYPISEKIFQDNNLEGTIQFFY